MQKGTTLVNSGAKSVYSRTKLRLRLITRNCSTVKKSALPKTLYLFLCMRVFTKSTSRRKGLWTPWSKNLQSSRTRMSSGEAPRQATMPGRVEMAAIAWETSLNSARVFLVSFQSALRRLGPVVLVPEATIQIEEHSIDLKLKRVVSLLNDMAPDVFHQLKKKMVE